MPQPPEPAPVAALPDTAPGVINIGVDLFAEALAAQDVPVVQVLWSPPETPDDDLMSLLDSLI